MEDNDITTIDSSQSNGKIFVQRAANLGMAVGRSASTGNPPSNEYHNFRSFGTGVGSSLTMDQSFLPSSNGSIKFEYSNDERLPFSDLARNLVQGMPVIPAEDIEESTASMIEIRQPAPKKAIMGVTANNICTSKDNPQQDAVQPPIVTKRKPCSKRAARRARLWSTVKNEEDFIRLMEEFRRQGFPLGLATEVCADKMEAPYRIWLVDNNSSLEQFEDQHVLRYRAEDQSVQLAPCTRWVELVETLESHALLADLMKVNANFWLIRGERVEFSLPNTDVRTAFSTLRNSHTSHARLPWKMIFDSTYKRIQRGAHGYRSVVVVAGARMPSTISHAEEFWEAIQVLKDTGASVVIRLASKDVRAAQYYESLGADGTLDIHVVGDFLDTANRVFRANPWLNYTLQLHRCREMGFNPQVFGKLEQRPLDKDELREFMVILFGKNAMLKAPDVHWDWPDFYQFLSEKNSAEGMHWRMASGRMEPWIDIRLLNKTYWSEAMRKDISRNTSDNLIEL